MFPLQQSNKHIIWDYKSENGEMKKKNIKSSANSNLQMPWEPVAVGSSPTFPIWLEVAQLVRAQYKMRNVKETYNLCSRQQRYICTIADCNTA